MNSEVWEELEADSEEALKEDEDERGVIVEEEDKADAEIEEDPEEVTPVKETENDKITKDSPRVDEEESEERERKNSEEYADSTPTSPSISDFIVMPISQKRPTPETDSDPQEERENYSSMKKAKKGNNDKSTPSLAASSARGGRVWCHEDEITVLEGMIEYKNKEGTYPPNDMVALHDFIKWKLLSDMSRTQMYEKVKRLKKKFFINLGKVEDCVEPAFSKPHDYVLFDLSRKIWGDVNTNRRRRRRRGGGKSTDDNNDDDQRKSDNVRRKNNNRKSRKQPVIEGYNGSSSFIKEVKKEEVTMDDDDDSEGDFELKYPFLSEALCKERWGTELADSVKRLLKEKLCSIGNAKAKELENQWKEIREQEKEIFLQKMNLIALQTELMFKGSKNR